uniref:Uncharacterized protein n=1 Tax=Opuntia streptacantha TaxID=393608 RepID=A0A7C9DDP2_OPUST
MSSHPLTHGCPGVARVSGAEWLSRALEIFSRTAEKTGFLLTDSGGCSCPISHFHRSGFSRSRTWMRDLIPFSSIELIFSSTHFPNTRSNSKNPLCLLLYNNLLIRRLLLSESERSLSFVYNR